MFFNYSPVFVEFNSFMNVRRKRGYSDLCVFGSDVKLSSEVLDKRKHLLKVQSGLATRGIEEENDV